MIFCWAASTSETLTGPRFSSHRGPFLPHGLTYCWKWVPNRITCSFQARTISAWSTSFMTVCICLLSIRARSSNVNINSRICSARSGLDSSMVDRFGFGGFINRVQDFCNRFYSSNFCASTPAAFISSVNTSFISWTTPEECFPWQPFYRRHRPVHFLVGSLTLSRPVPDCSNKKEQAQWFVGAHYGCS